MPFTSLELTHTALAASFFPMRGICTLIAFGFVAGTAQGINIAGFNSLANDRFANDSSFIADSFDLSGVAISSANGRWLTMVSRNVFLSSNHFFPADGSDVTFYESNDPGGPSVTRTVTGGQRVGSSDIYIGTLDSFLPSSYAVYDFATEDITSALIGPDSFRNSSLNGLNAYLFGRSPSSFPKGQDMAVGRNRLDRWFDSASAEGTTDDAIGSNVESAGDSGFVSYESLLEVGDSGAPLFVEDGQGGLTLVGTNWFVTAGGDANGQAYVGNYDTEIQNFIDANVPEPGSFALLAGLGAGILSLFRRRLRRFAG